MTTHSIPLQAVHTNDPIVIFRYVGPLWWQSKHCLLWGNAAISRNILRCFSSCFLLAAILIFRGRCQITGSRSSFFFQRETRRADQMRPSFSYDQNNHSNTGLPSMFYTDLASFTQFRYYDAKNILFSWPIFNVIYAMPIKKLFQNADWWWKFDAFQ